MHLLRLEIKNIVGSRLRKLCMRSVECGGWLCVYLLTSKIMEKCCIPFKLREVAESTLKGTSKGTIMLELR
jgi:hypothetical protein